MTIKLVMEFGSIEEMVAAVGNANIGTVQSVEDDEATEEMEAKPSAKKASAKKSAAKKASAKKAASKKSKLADDGEPTQQDALDALKNVNSECGLDTARTVLSEFEVRRVSEMDPEDYQKFIDRCDEIVLGGA